MIKKYNRVIALAMSDTHAGFTLGLLNPETKIQDDDKKWVYPTLNESQEYLWKLNNKIKDNVFHLASKDPVYLFHLGDASWGNRFIREQISTRIADQIRAAAGNFEPWLEHKNVKYARMVKGTGVHAFGEGTAEILMEDILQAKYPKKDIRTVYHGLATINKAPIDYTHHGPYPGSRNWLKGNVARYYLRSLMMDEISAGEMPPVLVLRGHYHEYVKEVLWLASNGKDYESMLVIIPSMCLLSDFGRQVTKSVYRITNGMVAFEIINGKIHETHKFTSTLDIRTKEKLS